MQSYANVVVGTTDGAPENNYWRKAYCRINYKGNLDGIRKVFSKQGRRPRKNDILEREKEGSKKQTPHRSERIKSIKVSNNKPKCDNGVRSFCIDAIEVHSDKKGKLVEDEI